MGDGDRHRPVSATLPSRTRDSSSRPWLPTTWSAVLVGVVDDAPCGAVDRRVGRNVGAGAGRPLLGALEDGHRPLADRTLVAEDGRIVERSDTTTPSKNKTESARTLVESAFTTNYGRDGPLRCQHRR